VSLVTTGADLVPRVSLINTTVAPGMTPPCGSFTVPDTVPVVICASAGNETNRSASIAAMPLRTTLRTMLPPPMNEARSDWDSRSSGDATDYMAHGRDGARASQAKSPHIAALNQLEPISWRGHAMYPPSVGYGMHHRTR